MNVIVLPGRREFDTCRNLIMQGFNVTSIRGNYRQIMVAKYVPTLTSVVKLESRPAHKYLKWLELRT